MNTSLPSGVTHYTSGKPGPTLAIFAGVHGNELAGVMAIKKLKNTIKALLKSGSVYLVYGNPRAIKTNVRFVESNLNRMFVANTVLTTYEARRAKQLMPILDSCDALLDIHASNVPGSIPFLIGEQDTWEFARQTSFEIISNGWDEIEPGAADGYMYQQNKFGLCAECGYVGDSEAYCDLAYDTMIAFLKYWHVCDGVPTASDQPKKYLHAYQAIIKPSDTFVFTQPFEDFTNIPAGFTYAVDQDMAYKVTQDSVVLFANPNKEVGGEAIVLAKWTQDTSS